MTRPLLAVLTARTLSLVLAGSSTARAEPVGVAVEVDPAPFVLKGFAANVNYRFAESWLVGAAGFGFTLPSVINGLAVSPDVSSTEVRLTSGVTVFVHRYFRGNAGWFVGLQVGVSNFRITDDRPQGGETAYTTGLVMPRAGYKFRLGRTGLYLLPWGGVTFLPTGTATHRAGDVAYKARPVLPFGAVHLGYEF